MTKKEADELKRQISVLRQELSDEREERIKAEGKIELLEKQDERKGRDFVMERQSFQHEIEWLREVVMLMSIPKEKLDEIQKLRDERIRRY